MPQITVGCDLSRAFIDVCQNAGRAISRIQNTKYGIMEWIETLDPTAVIVFEATSGCDSILMDALAARHINYARINPRQAREFARACWASSPRQIASMQEFWPRWGSACL
ncbi:transposase IS116/IS110/IS902 family protein [Nitratireductor aquibiodomus RA22]|uniref:Transposase IS116/IS110/IS902 family protein n=1 Tax=Nitratireductor aquibiodomus RA22 TaxID=1189611 RepID=I5BWW2_9HYPH|nr:hypothetical protein [Nitratireductor aquibiodomus]EIM74064.1 transposase IS116/IS110/IS902 family protein [Nitratireductor aquibiodomus RA22]